MLDARARRIQEETKSGVYSRAVAANAHRELGRLGGVRPPREFVSMDRAAIGLGSVFLHLAAEINWHALFEDLIQDFDAKRLKRRRAAMLKKAAVPPPD